MRSLVLTAMLARRGIPSVGRHRRPAGARVRGPCVGRRVTAPPSCRPAGTVAWSRFDAATAAGSRGRRRDLQSTAVVHARDCRRRARLGAPDPSSLPGRLPWRIPQVTSGVPATSSAWSSGISGTPSSVVGERERREREFAHLLASAYAEEGPCLTPFASGLVRRRLLRRCEPTRRRCGRSLRQLLRLPRPCGRRRLLRVRAGTAAAMRSPGDRDRTRSAIVACARRRWCARVHDLVRRRPEGRDRRVAGDRADRSGGDPYWRRSTRRFEPTSRAELVSGLWDHVESAVGRRLVRGGRRPS